MIGAAVIVVVLVVVIPVLTLMGSAVLAAFLGEGFRRHGERSHEGSEFNDLNT